MTETQELTASTTTNQSDADRRIARSAVVSAPAALLWNWIFAVDNGHWAAFGPMVVDADIFLFDFRFRDAMVRGTIYPLADTRCQLALDFVDDSDTHDSELIETLTLMIENLIHSVVHSWVTEVFSPATAADSSLTQGTVEVSVQAFVAIEPDVVWELVGDRYGFRHWHPMINDSLPLHDGRHRRDMLQGLADGGTLEKFLHHDASERTYAYAKVADDRVDTSWSITKARYFFPFSQYMAVLRVDPAEGGCLATWTGWLTLDEGIDSAGVERARQQTTRFYSSGFEALVARFAGHMKSPPRA